MGLVLELFLIIIPMLLLYILQHCFPRKHPYNKLPGLLGGKCLELLKTSEGWE